MLVRNQPGKGCRRAISGVTIMQQGQENLPLRQAPPEVRVRLGDDARIGNDPLPVKRSTAIAHGWQASARVFNDGLEVLRVARNGVSDNGVNVPVGGQAAAQGRVEQGLLLVRWCRDQALPT